MAISNNKVNLCSSCKNEVPTCPGSQESIKFGDGIGNDNVAACSHYDALMTRVVRFDDKADSSAYRPTDEDLSESIGPCAWVKDQSRAFSIEGNDQEDKVLKIVDEAIANKNAFMLGNALLPYAIDYIASRKNDFDIEHKESTEDPYSARGVKPEDFGV